MQIILGPMNTFFKLQENTLIVLGKFIDLGFYLGCFFEIFRRVFSKLEFLHLFKRCLNNTKPEMLGFLICTITKQRRSLFFPSGQIVLFQNLCFKVDLCQEDYARSVLEIFLIKGFLVM